MDYRSYHKAYFADPPPEPRYLFCGSFGVTLFFQDYGAAVAYYEQVLGPPGYVEGEGTKGWRIGSGWLTLLQGNAGNPRNVEITFEVNTPDEAEKLQRAFIEAGGHGTAPSNQLMYVPVRSCPVVDPFGTELLIVSALEGKPTN